MSRVSKKSTANRTSGVWKEFGDNPVTHSVVHHLLAVLELVSSRGYARTVDVAKFLSITSGSASTNLKKIKQKGLIAEDENRFLHLTKAGQEIAELTIARRRIIEEFLVTILGVGKEQAEIDACKTEHLLSEETTKKMADLVRRQAKG